MPSWAANRSNVVTWHQTPQSRAELRRAKLAPLIFDLLVAALGVTCPFTVHLVGSLPIAEIIVLALIPMLLVARGRTIFRSDLRPIYALCALWLFAQIMTDLYRGMTAPEQWMRSYAAIIFFVFDIMVMAALTSGSTRRKLIFFGFYAGSTLLQARFFPTTLVMEPSWKFGYADGTMTLVLLLSCFFYSRRRYSIVVVLFLALIAVNLLENFRSPLLFLFVTLAIVVPFIPERVGNLQLLPGKGSAIRVATVVALSLVAGLAARSILGWATERGLAGEEAQQKNEQQAASGYWLDYLFAGRPEFRISLQAVADSPLIGHGSDPDEPKYLEMFTDRQIESGGVDMLQSLSEWLGGHIPVHSFVLQAWVGAGVLGSLVWFYLLAVCVKSILRVAITLPSAAPYFTFLFMEFFWGIFFSPFGSTERLTIACTILMMVDLLQSAEPVSSLAQGETVSGWRRGRWTRQTGGRHIPLRT